MPMNVASSVAAHSSAPPARVLDRVYIEAMGAPWDMMAIPRKLSKGTPNARLASLAP